MPGGSNSEFNALYAIACSTGAMAENSGGVAAGGLVTEDDLVFAIACNLRATVIGLGGDGCSPGWVDIDSAWTAILLFSAQLTGLTGTAANNGSTASIEGKIYGTLCNLTQVANNTATPIPPPDPVQEFIDALLAFGPDVLLVADKGISASPVALWADQSGNSNDASATGTAQPTLAAASVNGHNSVLFDGVNDVMFGNFVDTGHEITDITVYSGAISGGTGGRILTVGTIGVDEAGSVDGCINLRYNDNAAQIGTYRASIGADGELATVRNVFHLTTSQQQNSPPASALTEDGVTNGGQASNPPFNTTAYGLASSMASNSFFGGNIAFRFLKSSYLSAPDLAVVQALVKAFYATP